MTNDKDLLEQNELHRNSHKLYMYFKKRRVFKAEKQRRRVIQSSLNTFKTEYEKAEIDGDNNRKMLFNIALYHHIIEYDVSGLAFQMFDEIDKFPRKNLSRQLVVLMYESTLDLQKLFGKDFRRLLKQIDDSDILKEHLNEVSKMINLFKSNHIEYLKSVRNNCGAHRDLNAYVQITYIEELNIDIVTKIASEFMAIIREIARFMIQVLRAYNSNLNQES